MDDLYDAVIIGGGPAGLTAAIYLTRAKYRVLLLEKDRFGGQITISHEVVNYPGVGVCSGKTLTDVMYRQAEYFGTEFLIAEATKLETDADVKTVHTDKGDFKCLSILLATGAHPRSVGFQGEEEFKGRGVAYCATCDGEFFTGKEVFVIGGGFAAAEESVFLTKFAKHITILIITDDFTCAGAVAEQARNHEKITVLTNTIVEAVGGESVVNYIRYKNTVTGEVTQYSGENGESIGVFVFAGYSPETGLADGIAEKNEQGYIITDKAQRTTADGLFAAGDICIKPLRQVVTATSDGAMAATEMEKYISDVQHRTGLAAKEPTIKPEALADIKKASSQSLNKNSDAAADGDLFDDEMRTQLNVMFERMEQPLVLKLYLDDRSASSQLEEYMRQLANMTEKLTVETGTESEAYTPCVRLYRQDGSYTGLAFHGVPGGHEFTSFVLGMYNAAGPGQPLTESVRSQIGEIKKHTEIRIFVSLSCTMCPDLVVAAQHIAAISENVSAEVYDLQHFPELREKYNVMSVPCMLVGEKVFFGKKSSEQVLEILKSEQST